MKKILLFITLLLTYQQSAFCQANNPERLSAGPDLHELTITQAQQMMASGDLSSERLVKYYLKRIAAHNSKGKNLNAVVQLNEHALSDARSLDVERKKNKIRGPLHGIPVLLKDNIDTNDGMVNSAGSHALADNKPSHDAFVVNQLRKAGAVILGKTNLSEWANFRSTRSASGWSGLWGQTRNPYNTDNSPCGSSSGSGVAIAADFALLAIGTETDGSVTCPSAINGIVGIKPSLGTVSRHGIIPIAHSQDTAGPMARTVTDAVILLDSMVAFDKQDPQALKGKSNLIKHLKADGLNNKRIGIVRNLMGYHSDIDKLTEQAIAVLKKQGAVIVDDVELPNLDKIGEHEYTVLLFEFKHDLNQYLKNAKTGLSLEKLIAFNETNAVKEMPFFGQEIFLMAQEKGDLSDKEYREALQQAKLMAGSQGIDAVMKDKQLDVLIAPTTHAAWKIDLVNGDHYLGAASTPAAVSGYPHITVPMGYLHGLPVGLSFFGANLSEPILIEAAYGYEQATKHRKPPQL